MFIKYPSENNFSFDKNEESTDKDFYTFEDSVMRIENGEQDHIELQEERLPKLSDFSPLKNNLVKKVIPHNYHHKPKCPHCNKIYSVTKPCACCGFYGGDHKLPKYKLKQDMEYKYKDICPVCEAPYTSKDPCFNCGYFIGKPIFYPFNKMIPNPLYIGKKRDEEDLEVGEKDQNFSHIEGDYHRDSERNEEKYYFSKEEKISDVKDVHDEIEDLVVKKMKEYFKNQKNHKENNEIEKPVCESCKNIEEKKVVEKPITKITQLKETGCGDKKELEVKFKTEIEKEQTVKKQPIKIEIKPKKELVKKKESMPVDKIGTKFEVQKFDMLEIKGSIKPVKSKETIGLECNDNTKYEFIDDEYFKSKDWETSEEKIDGKSKNKNKEHEKDKDKHKKKDKHKDKDKCRDKKKDSKRKKR